MSDVCHQSSWSSVSKAPDNLHIGMFTGDQVMYATNPDGPLSLKRLTTCILVCFRGVPSDVCHHPHGPLSLNIPICKLSGALETEDHEDWWHTSGTPETTICKCQAL